MPADTGPKQRKPRGLGQRFTPGQSGNPNGHPAGARSRVTLLAQRMMDADAEGVIRALLEVAKGGDTTAIRMVLERTAPLPRSRPVWLAMPPIDTPGDLAAV